MTDAARQGFGHDTTTDEVLAGIDLSGRTAVVTGGSSGLGAETARALASKGAAVTLTARDIAKGEQVAEAIRTSTGNPDMGVASVELASLAGVRAGADEILGRIEDIDAPALIRGGPTRVVGLSSRRHFRSSVRFDDIGFERDGYDKWSAYGQSKTANVLFAVELDRRLADRGVRAFAVHPGVIMTDLARHLRQADIDEMQSRAPGGAMRMKTVESGAATSVFAATAPELDGRGGAYLEDCHIAEVDDENTNEGVLSYAVDPDAARRLWSLSEELVGQSFDLD